jgi:hypothetical protein
MFCRGMGLNFLLTWVFYTYILHIDDSMFPSVEADPQTSLIQQGAMPAFGTFLVSQQTTLQQFNWSLHNYLICIAGVLDNNIYNSSQLSKGNLTTIHWDGVTSSLFELNDYAY